MPVLVLKALECNLAQGALDSLTKGLPDEIRLLVASDAVVTRNFRSTARTFDRVMFNDARIFFRDRIELVLIEEDPGLDVDDWLGRHTLDASLAPRGKLSFDEDGADYDLWYEVVDPAVGLELGEIRLRAMLERGGTGVVPESELDEVIGRDTIYRAQEEIRLSEVRAFHEQQDWRGRSPTSVRSWLEIHANVWGDRTVIPLDEMPEPNTGFEVLPNHNWEVVEDEETRSVAGIVVDSYLTNTDNPFSHETMDWNWNQLVDPHYLYMVAYSAKWKRTAGHLPYPVMHNEQESGSFPLEWRPFRGEYVVTSGRHIFDMGHFPMRSEIHPAPTIIKERTTAAQLARNGPTVAVNRACIGAGFSGGFTRHVASDPFKTRARWNHEFGGVPGVIGADQKSVWPTNLKKRRIKHKIYPPFARPPGAQLAWRVARAEIIVAEDGEAVDDFLDLCQRNPWRTTARPRRYGFRMWRPTEGVPDGFPPRAAVGAEQPRIVDFGTHIEVTIDLSGVTGIPLGYFAEIDCGWSIQGPEPIYRFDVLFDELTVHDIRDPGLDDWFLFFGVNGHWEGWWKDSYVDSNHTYNIGRTITAHTAGDVPLLLRDCGIEWQGHASGHPDVAEGNVALDEVSLTARAADHLGGVHATASNNHRIVESVLSGDERTEQTLRLKIKGQPDGNLGFRATLHEWNLRIQRRVVHEGET